MRRIPIYRFINNAGVYISAKKGCLAIGRLEWELYLKNLFEKSGIINYPAKGSVRRVQEEEIKSLITLLEDKLSALSSSYLNISGKPYYSKAEDLLTYDSPSKREQSIEASSLAESLYEITEFHERILSFMKALVYDGALECMLPLSA